jgi:hypothetical protein
MLPDPDGDIDLVLLSKNTSNIQSDPLKELLVLLKKCPQLVPYSIWHVTATVPLVKIQRNKESLDILWLSDCHYNESTNREESITQGCCSVKKETSSFGCFCVTRRLRTCPYLICASIRGMEWAPLL